MKAKQISNRTFLELDREQVLFAEVMNRLENDTDAIVSFFQGFLDLTPTQIKLSKKPFSREYHKIAKQMLPLDA